MAALTAKNKKNIKYSSHSSPYMFQVLKISQLGYALSYKLYSEPQAAQFLGQSVDAVPAVWQEREINSSIMLVYKLFREDNKFCCPVGENPKFILCWTNQKWKNYQCSWKNWSLNDYTGEGSSVLEITGKDRGFRE